MAQHIKSASSKSAFLNILKHNFGIGSQSHAARHLRPNLRNGPPRQNPISRLCNTMAEKLSSIGLHDNQVHPLLSIPITPLDCSVPFSAR